MRPLATCLSLLAGLFLCRSLRGQSCGPFTVAIGPNGTGCSPSGGVVPVLLAQAAGSGAIPPCYISFTMTPPPAGAAALLIVGASDPALDLAPVGLPGCVLRASPDLLLYMGWASPYCAPPPMMCPSGYFVRSVILPPDPSLVGSTAYVQALLLNGYWPNPADPRLSNGFSVTLL